jgi:hypothetical protein
VGRFTPDLYPTAPPLAAAAGPPPSDADVAAALDAFLPVHLGGNTSRIDAALARFDDAQVIERLPDAAIRAGFLTLTGTLGDPMVGLLLSGRLPIIQITFGEPLDPHQVVGIPVDGPATHRVVDERFRCEHFALLAGSILHNLLHHEPVVSDAEETLGHGLRAAVHLQMISRSPELAGTTELARRQNSLALALLCSRSPGSAAVRLIAPDGLGTIPGGDPSQQAPDFWSIPFAPHRPEPAPPTPAFGVLLDSLLGEVARSDRPVLIDRAMAEMIDDHVLTRELRPHELVQAAIALTVLDADDTDEGTG